MRGRSARASGTRKTVLLGVDRLDYTKGIRHRIKAFGELVEDGRIAVEDATLVQVASPSASGRHVRGAPRRDRADGGPGSTATSGSSGTSRSRTCTTGTRVRRWWRSTWPPDIMLVTALRDGMNLVAKEYVAARFDNDGVLILSEFAGAADELKQAVIVKPARHRRAEGTPSSARSRCSAAKRSTRMRALRKRVRDNDVARWSRSFLEALDRHAPRNAQIDPSAVDPKDQHREAQTDNMSIFDQDAQTARAAEDTREARDA